MNMAADARSFRQAKEEERLHAAQLAALFLTCGVEMDEAMGLCRQSRAKIIARLERIIERERLRGQRGHWSYDLNRHIALKQGLDRLRQVDA